MAPNQNRGLIKGLRDRLARVSLTTCICASGACGP